MSNNIGVMINYRTKSLEVVISPYYQSKNIICATTMFGEDVSCRPIDFYALPEFNSRLSFFETVRESFRATVTLSAKSAYKTLPFTILNGVCTLHLSSEDRYSVQFSFEKGLKLNEKIVLHYDASTASYIVSTDGYVRRAIRYDNRTPRGESYERIIVALRQLGPMSTAEIAFALGLSENRVSGRISEMHKCGLVHKHGSKSVEGRTQTIWTLSKKRYD